MGGTASRQGTGDGTSDEKVAMLNASVEFAKLGVRSAFILNGAALVSSIAGLSTLLASDNVDVPTAQAGTALQWFLWGLLVAALTLVVAYGTQVLYHKENDYWGDRARVIGVTMWLASLLFFAFGAYALIDFISAINTTATTSVTP